MRIPKTVAKTNYYWVPKNHPTNHKRQPMKGLGGFVSSVDQQGTHWPSQRERLRDSSALGSLPSHYQHINIKPTVLLNHLFSSFPRGNAINTKVWRFTFTLHQQLGIDMKNTY